MARFKNNIMTKIRVAFKVLIDPDFMLKPLNTYDFFNNPCILDMKHYKGFVFMLCEFESFIESAEFFINVPYGFVQLSHYRLDDDIDEADPFMKDFLNNVKPQNAKSTPIKFENAFHELLLSKSLTHVFNTSNPFEIMALSDYLTNSEWNACFYYYMQPNNTFTSLGDAMHKTINDLLSEGYRFEGLNEDGSKKHQVENGVNAPKISMFFEGASPKRILELVNDGREFLKEKAPNLLLETDEEWIKLTTNDE